MGFPFGLSGVGVGAVLAAFGMMDPNPRRSMALVAGGLGVVLFSMKRAGLDVLGGYQEAYSDLEHEAEVGPGVMGVVGRLVTGTNDPTLSSWMELPADPDAFSGNYLGKAKNISRVAGVFRTPQEGETINRQTLARTYKLEGALENQSSTRQSGTPEVWVREHGLIGSLGGETDIKVPGETVTLEPGALHGVQVVIPAALFLTLAGGPMNPHTERFGGFSPNVDATARLLWNGHIVSKVEFVRG